MIYAILLAPAAFCSLSLVTLILFLAVMKLKDVRDAGKLPPDLETPAKIILFIGLGVDFLFNVMCGSLIFREPPKEFLFTTRLERHKYGADGWRKERAIWWCDHLDPFDGGCHCKQP